MVSSSFFFIKYQMLLELELWTDTNLSI
jgi:hypothetical protein